MNDIYLAKTAQSPEVDFRFREHVLSMTGEAYPENANEFFHPILNALENYLASNDGKDIEFNFRLTYFNSAATKMLFNMFDLLNESAASSNRIVLNWYHDEDDDTILEFGEGIQDDFQALEFRAIATTSA
jgi:hypothetical protein